MTQLACCADVLRLDKCSITKNKLPWGRLMQTIREADNGNWVPVFQTSYLGDEENQPALNTGDRLSPSLGPPCSHKH